MQKLNKDNFKALALEPGIPVFVTYCAPWCKFCGIIHPIVEEIAREFEGKAAFYEVDADAEPALSSEQGVISVPTMILYVKGRAVMRSVGFQSKADIVDNLKKALAEQP